MEGGRIDGKLEMSDSSSELVKQSGDEISHLAIDIGGSLIKIVYFSTNSKCSTNDEAPTLSKERKEVPNGDLNHHILSGRLYFVKFETSKIEDCIKFLSSKKLQQCGAQCHHSHADDKIKIKATGGGAFKFTNLFKEKLGITLDKVEEMESLVAGANFLLKAVNHEAYTYIGGQKEYVQIDQNDLYPYLLVNIGSGVSMIKVDGDGKFQRVSGTSVGGGTFWGLGKLLTKCQSFDELLELSHQGNNRVIDMLVGDIYGGLDYSKDPERKAPSHDVRFGMVLQPMQTQIETNSCALLEICINPLEIGLASTAIASSFGKAISENKELEDYKPEDIARSLLRMISNNIGQIAYLNALRFGLKRIFLGGFFIRDHAYTMDTISVAVDFWSKGEAKAMFLRHEGFLGALGAFMNYKDGNADLCPPQLVEQQTPKSSNCIVDRIHNSTRVRENENGAIDCRLRVSSSFKIYDEVKRC